MTNRKRPADDSLTMAVHRRHCYQGDYADSCKYGDPDCPAAPPELCDDEGCDHFGAAHVCIDASRPQPCPFCGSGEDEGALEIEIFEAAADDGDFYGGYITCHACSTSGPVCNGARSPEEARAAIIATWNKRAPRGFARITPETPDQAESFGRWQREGDDMVVKDRSGRVVVRQPIRKDDDDQG